MRDAIGGERDEGAVRDNIRVANEAGAYGYARAACGQDLGYRHVIWREREVPLL